MIISHYKRTPVAFAPEAISDIINKYTDNYSYVVGFSYPTRKIFPQTDIVHQHNVDEVDFKRKLIQYHSEPFRVHLDNTTPKFVIAQYHATLPEYSGCGLVRNPIDLYDDHFFPKYYDKKIRIGYSPSTTKPGSKWADKGYEETVEILSNIKNRLNNIVDIDIIKDVALGECLIRKSLCNLFIDEVKTSSYHRSGLEALGMGIATICSIGADVEEIMLNVSGAKNNPFINCGILELETVVENYIEAGVCALLEKGYESRLWMERYWHPQDIANEYIEIYANQLMY